MSDETTVRYGSVIEALEAGQCYARNIAQSTGKHVSTVRKILRGYEADGRAYRQPAEAVEEPDFWRPTFLR